MIYDVRIPPNLITPVATSLNFARPVGNYAEPPIRHRRTGLTEGPWAAQIYGDFAKIHPYRPLIRKVGYPTP